MTTSEPQLPSPASPLYKALHEAAIELIHSQDQDSASATRINNNRIRAIRSKTSFQHSFGHNYFVSTAPHLADTLDVEGFIGHLEKMTPFLESWETRITDVVVDEARMVVVVRASYWMRVKGKGGEGEGGKGVENDLIWWLWMEREGDGGDGEVRVKKSMEFVDGVASLKLGETIRASKA